MTSLLDVFLSKKDDYIFHDNQRKQQDVDRRITADEQIEKFLEDFDETLKQTILKSTSPSFTIFIKYGKITQRVYNEDTYLEILKGKIEKLLPDFLSISSMHIRTQVHQTYGKLSSAVIVLVPDIDIFN